MHLDIDKLQQPGFKWGHTTHSCGFISHQSLCDKWTATCWIFPFIIIGNGCVCWEFVWWLPWGLTGEVPLRGVLMVKFQTMLKSWSSAQQETWAKNNSQGERCCQLHRNTRTQKCTVKRAIRTENGNTWAAASRGRKATCMRPKCARVWDTEMHLVKVEHKQKQYKIKIWI